LIFRALGVFIDAFGVTGPAPAAEADPATPSLSSAVAGFYCTLVLSPVDDDAR
jgi:hypothetical protein